MGGVVEGHRCQLSASVAIRAFAEALEDQAIDGNVSVQAVRRMRDLLSEDAGPLAGHYRMTETACAQILVAPQLDRPPGDHPVFNGSAIGSKELKVKRPAKLPLRLIRRRSRSGVLAAGIGITAVAVLGWLAMQNEPFWQSSRSTADSNLSDANKFVAQLTDVASGSGLVTHVFGGQVKREENGGRPAIIAEGVPQRVCGATAWMLSRKGIISVNGVTPRQVSRIGVIDLCNKNEGNVTIVWSPKPTGQKTPGQEETAQQ